MSECYSLVDYAGTIEVLDRVVISPTTLDVEDLYLSPEKAVELAVEILLKWPALAAKVLYGKFPPVDDTTGNSDPVL